MALDDEVAKLIAGKSDAELAREAHAHLLIAFLYAPSPALEIALANLSRHFVEKWGHGPHEAEAIRNDAMVRMVGFEALKVKGVRG